MLTGRKFAARFKNSSAREAYLTWSAGQMFIYNECVLEQRFFDSLSRLIAETERHKLPIRNECRIARPKPDQKYAHLVDKAQRPWLSQAPLGNFGHRCFSFLSGLKKGGNRTGCSSQVARHQRRRSSSAADASLLYD